MDDGADEQRWAPEPGKRAGRSAYQRDRARVLHSAALRRLAAKTQVHVAFEHDFPRTRLTHSLECAQIGRELGAALGADPDVVEAACLAHDLGHPPFGHNGEAALDAAAGPIGGFEGNAQTLRILTRLEAKTLITTGGVVRSAGLNLTRATLDAATKYPWERREGTRKFGVYADDREVFDWYRTGAPGERRSFEAQVMDWADDVAYSVHDLEDAIHSGDLDLRVLHDSAERVELLALCRARYVAGDVEPGELEAALDRLLALPPWPTDYDGGLVALSGLKALTSTLIGRFCSAAEQATRQEFGESPLRRYGADVVVPRDARLECAVLKAVTARYVMERPGTEVRYAREAELVRELVEAVAERAPAVLDPVLASSYAQAPDDAARLRVVVDQVASLSDTSAVEAHARLLARPGPSSRP